MKYKVKKNYKIIPKGEILEENSNGEYNFSIEEGDIITSISVDKETIEKETDYFEPLLKVNISNEDIDDTNVKNWKVVFNLKCTEKDLLDVQNIIKKKLGKYV